MKKSLTIKPEVLTRLTELPKDQRSECLLAICELAEAFGRPHLHTGLSIRKLTKTVFECRGNLKLRFLFYNHPSDLYVFFLGDHDEVRAKIKER